MFARGNPEKCHRCLQPVPHNSRRCPHCGDMLKVSARKLSLYFGLLGLLAILGIIVIGLSMKTPPSDPANGDSREDVAPPKAPKKPVLD